MRTHLTATQNGPDLLLYLHGSLQSAKVASRFTDRTFERIAATICYPEGVAHHWNDARRHLTERTRELGTDDVAYLTDLAASFTAGHPSARVFAVGYSNGAQMVIRLLHDAPGFLSGAALIAGPMPAPSNFLSTAEGFQPTPILTMHGELDTLSPIDGSHAGGAIRAARGEHLSFKESNRYFAGLNGCVDGPATFTRHGFQVERWEGQAPVEAWTLHGVGHHVPTTRPVPSEVLGPASKHFIAADAIAEFFGLGLVEQARR